MADVLQAIKDLVHTYPPEVEAYLFGSRARGDNRPDSDWDILLIADKERVRKEDHDNYTAPLGELGWDIDASINAIIFSKKDWELGARRGLFYHNVMQDRIRL